MRNQRDVAVLQHVHVNETGVLSEDPDLREMRDPRLPEPLLVGSRGGGNITLMLLEDDAGFVGQLLRCPEQRIGGGAEAIDRDVAADERIGVPVPVQLAPELIETAL